MSNSRSNERSLSPRAPPPYDSTTFEIFSPPQFIPLLELPGRPSAPASRNDSQSAQTSPSSPASCVWCLAQDAPGTTSRLVRTNASQSRNGVAPAYACVQCMLVQNRGFLEPGSTLKTISGGKILVCLWCGIPAMDGVVVGTQSAFVHLPCCTGYQFACHAHTRVFLFQLLLLFGVLIMNYLLWNNPDRPMMTVMLVSHIPVQP